MTDKKKLGRPVVKPTRKTTTFGINKDFPDKIQMLQIKRGGGCSVNDLINEAIGDLLDKEKIK